MIISHQWRVEERLLNDKQPILPLIYIGPEEVYQITGSIHPAIDARSPPNPSECTWLLVASSLIKENYISSKFEVITVVVGTQTSCHKT